MQTLFNKLKKLEKQNNILVNTFLANFLIITVLLMNSVDLTGFKFFIIKLFPLINPQLLLGLLGILVIGEMIIIEKVENNNQEILRIKKEIQKIKKDEKEGKKMKNNSQEKQKSDTIKIEDKEIIKDTLIDNIVHYQLDDDRLPNDEDNNLINKKNNIKVKKITK